MKTFALPLLAALAMTACSSGPDFRRPAAPAEQSYRTQPERSAAQGDGQYFVAGADLPAQWWELFHSPQLDALVQQALAANPNLDAARSALRAAQELAAAQRGAFLPQASAGFNPTRQKSADLLSSPLNAPANPFSLHTAQLSVGYVPDVFGGNRRLVEFLEAQAETQRFELEAARLSLAANVVAAAIAEAALRGQIAATERSVELQVKTLAIARRQFELGAIAEAGVVAQEAALAQTRAALPPLRRQLAQNRDLMAALAGGYPDHELAQQFDLEHLELPRALPLSLPSQLVEQRPDVRAAAALAHAAAAQVGVAAANRLPQFSITAGMGSVADHLGGLLQPGGGFWSLAGSVSQTLFDGGALKHRQSAAEANYDQAMAQYRGVAIAAFQNVADTLHALDQDGAALDAAGAAEMAAARSLAIAQRQLELGDISQLALINAEQAWQQASLALLQARAARYADTAALFQALGGGWWHEARPKP